MKKKKKKKKTPFDIEAALSQNTAEDAGDTNEKENQEPAVDETDGNPFQIYSYWANTGKQGTFWVFPCVRYCRSSSFIAMENLWFL